MALVYGVAAISGHVWSVFLRFKGGKGVATAAGAMLALAPVAVAVSILAWIGLALITRVVSIGSLVAAALVPVLAFYEDAPPETILFALGLTVLVWWTHRSNLGRLLRGEELPFRPNPTTGGSAGEMPGDPPGSRPADQGVGREEP
jgi:glycerol-3-phosphate acyltransferase PlsY